MTQLLGHRLGLLRGGRAESGLDEAMLIGFALLVVINNEAHVALRVLLAILQRGSDLELVSFAREQLSDTSDVVRVSAGAGFVEFGRNKEGELLACGDVVDSKRVIQSGTGREVLTPSHGGGTTQGLSIKKRNQDFVASLRRCHG